METGKQFETSHIYCPYCGETVELVLEADVMGELVVDCEVCCRPILISVSADSSGEALLTLSRDDE